MTDISQNDTGNVKTSENLTFSPDNAAPRWRALDRLLSSTPKIRAQISENTQVMAAGREETLGMFAYCSLILH